MQGLGERLSYNGISFYSWSPEMQSAVKSPVPGRNGGSHRRHWLHRPGATMPEDYAIRGPSPPRCYARTLARWQTRPPFIDACHGRQPRARVRMGRGARRARP